MNLRGNADFRPGNVAAAMEQIIPRALAGTEQAVTIVAITAKEFAPVASGDLANSIEWEVSLIGQTVQGAVEATAPHSAFVEYGTGLIGETSPHGELPQEGVPFTGNWQYDFRGQGWKGMRAQPFLRPALDVNSQRILDAYASEGFYI